MKTNDLSITHVRDVLTLHTNHEAAQLLGIGETAVQRLRRITNIASPKYKATPRRNALITILHRRRLSTRELAMMFGIHQLSVLACLRRMEKTGEARRSGRGPATKWTTIRKRRHSQ